jgi:proteasome-associated ATPase
MSRKPEDEGRNAEPFVTPREARPDGSSDPDVERLHQRIRLLERHIEEQSEFQSLLETAAAMNKKLEEALRKARDEIRVLKDEIAKLTSPPNTFATLDTLYPDRREADIYLSGRKMRVQMSTELDLSTLSHGEPVLLNEAFNIIGPAPSERQGEIVYVKEILDAGRIIVSGESGVDRAALLSRSLPSGTLAVGDHVMMDARSGIILEKLPKSEVGQVVLEEIPDVSFEDIGGLDEELEIVRDAVELPFLYPDLFKEYYLPAPKGVLLYGPPGCGKTLIAKAVANSVGRRMEQVHGQDARSYFLHVKGPELLNKYVGESERQIREVFARAREKAREGVPVIVFFDEMDSLFRTRGSGVSSDMESTIVPQFLAEIDGVERLRNVIVIGASNRQDLIDPAILRPGRLDVRVRIDRPNEAKAKMIFSKYFRAPIPLSREILSQVGKDRQKAVESLIDQAVSRMYAQTDENRFLEVTYANGEKEVLYFKDFASGAMIEGIMARAKKEAIKREIRDPASRGLQLEDILQGIRREYQENEDLPNTTNPDDWARIAGRKSERISHVKTLAGRSPKARPIETVPAGHYL